MAGDMTPGYDPDSNPKHDAWPRPEAIAASNEQADQEGIEGSHDKRA